jgi:hypothetical protein
MNQNIETLKKKVTELKNSVWNDDVKKQVSELRKSVKDPEFRTKIVENLKKTGTTAQEVAMDLIRQGKNSQYFDQYVMPVVESPKTESALKKLNERYEASHFEKEKPCFLFVHPSRSPLFLLLLKLTLFPRRDRLLWLPSRTPLRLKPVRKSHALAVMLSTWQSPWTWF